MCGTARTSREDDEMDVEKITDIYGLALFGIWTVLLAAVWVYILYDRHKNQTAAE